MPRFTRANSIIERIRRERPEEHERIKLASIDNTTWYPARVLVEYYERDNPSEILFRLFNSNQEFGNWISSSLNAQNVRMLTIKREIIYPNETEGACCICKR